MSQEIVAAPSMDTLAQTILVLKEQYKQSLITELLDFHWQVGREIHKQRVADDVSYLTLESKTRISQRTLAYCVQFYSKYPDHDYEVQSWRKHINELPSHPLPQLPENIEAPQYRLITGSIEDKASELDPGMVDWIVTDPPYGSEYLPLYYTLGEMAERVLKPGGSLAIMTGQSYLPEIYEAISKSLVYNWTLAYLTPGGQAAQLWDRKVNTFWKPVLWFTKGKYNGDWLGDVVKSNPNDNDKRFHDWGQSESGMLDLMKRMVKPGQIVLDPFVGGGTTGVIALKLGCQFIGIDSDSDMIAKTEQRLKEALAL